MRIAQCKSYRLARLAGVCLLVTAGLAAGAQLARVHSLAGQRAPAFTRLDLRGHAIDLGALRGKVVLLNFWATWCAPCLTEMPVFEVWQQAYGPQGFQAIGISMDDDRDAAHKLVEKLKIDYPVAMGDAKLGERYGGVLGLPMTFLIGRDGKVIAEFKGETDLKAMEAQVQAALNTR
jgi:cytochrome c biogenesis protein CcmG, thiol:disulfide interchange protein DsbE